MGVFSISQAAGLNSSRDAERRSSRALVSGLLSLSLMFAGFFPLPASALGSAPCEQSSNTDTGMTVVRSGNYCYIAFVYVNDADGQQDNTWNNPSGVTQVDALVVGGGGGGGGGVSSSFFTSCSYFTAPVR